MKFGKTKAPSDKDRIAALEQQMASVLDILNTLNNRVHGAAAALCGAQVNIPAPPVPPSDMNFKVQHDAAK